MLQRLLASLLNNPKVIESLSETRLMRRAAQITVGIFNQMKVARPPAKESSGGFLSSFKEEMEKEMKKKQLK